MTDQMIVVNIAEQRLTLIEGGIERQRFSVSTALNGVGQNNGSGCTPCGLHRVRIKIGSGCPVGSVFVGRRHTGEVFSDELAQKYPGRDWILSRILWLTGCEHGHNRGGDIDTLRRYIYIHGTPDSEPMGVPKSHGCVRMRNRDIVKLFDRVREGIAVKIVECE